MTFGLCLFIAVIALDVIGLSLDGILWLACGEVCTVTHLVRTSQPWIGFVILALQLAGMVGLACHFYPELER